MTQQEKIKANDGLILSLLADKTLTTDKEGNIFKGKRRLSQRIDPHGYLRIHIKVGDKRKFLRVHRIVMLDNCPEVTGMTVDHKNGDKTNNAPDNLRWLSLQDNIATANRKTRLDNEELLYIKASSLLNHSAGKIARELDRRLETVKPYMLQPIRLAS